MPDRSNPATVSEQDGPRASASQVPAPDLRPFPELAAALSRSRDEIIGEWLKLARGALPVMRRLSDEEVINNLVPVIDAMTAALAGAGEGYGDLNLIGGTHGMTRFHQRIDHSVLGSEYPLLRRLLAAHARHGLGRPMTADEADALHTLMDRIIQLSSTAYVELQEKEIRLENEVRSRHLAMLSHDVRNTLNAAMLSMQLIHERVADLRGSMPQLSELAGELDDCRRLTAGAVETMNRLLEAERLRQGVVQPRLTPVDLGGLLSSVRTAASRAVGKRWAGHPPGVEPGDPCPIELECPPGAIVHTDADLLSTILQNLVGNALLYACDGGVVRLAAAQEAGAWGISVIDRGKGIPRDQLESLFDIFSRGSEPGRNQAGTGLGLFIARRAADLLGAQLEVESTPGRGTTFTLTLPADPRSRFQASEGPALTP